MKFGPAQRSSRRLARILLALGLIFSAPAQHLSAQVEPTIARSAAFSGHLRDQQPNYLLPSQVTAPDGQLTFFADFQHPDAGSIPIYVVNRTRADAVFGSQDGDIYLKLQVQLPDGQWQRAQSHQSSWCGNSYVPATLPPGQFWRFAGYQPPDGRRAKIRFAIGGGETSATNAGDGLVSDADLTDANQDGITAGRVPFNLHLEISDAETDASTAKQNSWADRVTALRLVARWEENGYYRNRTEKLLQLAQAESSPDAAAAAKAIRGLLATPWPAKADPAAFVRACVAELQRPVAEPADFGAPGGNSPVVWGVLYDLARYQFVHGGYGSAHPETGIADWRGAILLARQQVDHTAEGTVTALLAIPALADELMEDRFYEERVGSSRKEVRAMAIATLARRSRFERLVTLGRELAPDYQVEVLAALADGGPYNVEGARARSPDAGVETAFWVECVKQRPAAALAELHQADGFGQRNSLFPQELEAAAQAFLQNEAAKVATAPEDFKISDSGLNQALLFLESQRTWTYDEEVLGKLLAHRGYDQMESSSSESDEIWEIHRFPFRQFALHVLEKMDRKPKEPVQVEKRFPLLKAAP